MAREVNVDEAATFEDDRGGFDQGPKKRVPGLKAFVYVMLLLGLLIMGWIVFQNLPGTHAAQDSSDSSGKSDAEDNAMKNSLPRYNFATTPSNATFDALKPKPETKPEKDKPDPTKVSQGQPNKAVPNGKKPELTPEEVALKRRLAAFNTGDNGSLNSTSQTGAQAQPVKATGQDGGSGGLLDGGSGGGTSKASGELDQRLNAAHHSSVSARMLPHPSLTVPMGTMILCGTTTEIDSTQPGMVGCQVSRDVYSADGKVRLIDKGTHVTGEVATAMKHGQDRVFVLWTRMRTPDSVIINLDSPGTNRLGSPGIPGQVDSHFWERFGGGILVSVISDLGEAAIQAAANSGSNTQNNINLGTTQSTTNQMAREVLRATIDIPPTLYAHQGKSVAIYVARDLDLSSVYGLSYDR